MRPYIGIADFTSFDQVEEMSRVFDSNRSDRSSRILHVGVMMSRKTLLGLPTRWQNIFPPKEKIAKIFSSDRVYNCLHYVDFGNNPDFEENLRAAISYGGLGIKAVQLDMTWPDPRKIAGAVKASGKKLEVILQIGKAALEKARSSREVVKRLNRYRGIVHRVLLDRSMGRGIEMDTSVLVPIALTIRGNFPGIGIGMAGGLGPRTIGLVEPVVKLIPDLSIDAQGKLRPSGDAFDPVDWEMAAIYLIRALEILE